MKTKANQNALISKEASALLTRYHTFLSHSLREIDNLLKNEQEYQAEPHASQEYRMS